MCICHIGHVHNCLLHWDRVTVVTMLQVEHASAQLTSKAIRQTFFESSWVHCNESSQQNKKWATRCVEVGVGQVTLVEVAVVIRVKVVHTLSDVACLDPQR